MLLDTGANASILPLSLSKRFCITPDSELQLRKGMGAGGEFTSYMLIKPPPIRARLATGIVVDEFDLPEIDFITDGADGENTPGILGRDAIFSNFDLRMTSEIIELTRK